MSWKCVCKEQNDDGSEFCSNCGRKRPVYLGVKVEVVEGEKMDSAQLAVWYLHIALSHLSDARKACEKHEELKGERGVADVSMHNVRVAAADTTVYRNYERCLGVLEKVAAMAADAQCKDEDGAVQSVATIKSNCFFTLGCLRFEERNFAEAIDCYQKSYEADPNQVSIYNIAMATKNLPVEVGGLFAGKKKQAAEEAKRAQEVELLMKTIKYAPFSAVGIRSGRLLMENYGVDDIRL